MIRQELLKIDLNLLDGVCKNLLATATENISVEVKSLFLYHPHCQRFVTDQQKYSYSIFYSLATALRLIKSRFSQIT